MKKEDKYQIWVTIAAPVTAFLILLLWRPIYRDTKSHKAAISRCEAKIGCIQNGHDWEYDFCVFWCHKMDHTYDTNGLIRHTGKYPQYTLHYKCRRCGAKVKVFADPNTGKAIKTVENLKYSDPGDFERQLATWD